MDHKKQQWPSAHSSTGSEEASVAPVFITEAQRHTFRSSHIFPLLFAISPKDDFILLTQQILFPFLKGKAEKMIFYLYPFTNSIFTWTFE